MRKLIAALLVSVICCGCGKKEFDTETMLPKGAIYIEDRGNGWHVFELTVDGKARRFLYHREYEGESHSRYSETVTELK
jgi:hypothetical protein